MISVTEAKKIILSELRDYGTELVNIQEATGSVLAEDIYADRDFPPYNRVTMDGIAISYNAIVNGVQVFSIKGTQAAGDNPIEIDSADQCVEIMTGAALPASTDTVIRYEDLEIKNGVAAIETNNIKPGQNVHTRGKDKKENQLLVSAGQLITPASINTAATVGKSQLLVKKLPKIVVLSNGDELVAVDAIPAPYEIRQSNSHATAAILLQQGIKADILHLPDDEAVIKKQLAHCLEQYDVLILSGGVSAGKFDYIPKAFEELGVTQKFHKVQQRPGKPFWFGVSKDNKLVFAFPGNPVSTFMCMYRYFIPWLQTTLGIEKNKPVYAVLDEDFTFAPPLQCFLQVKVNSNADGRLIAIPSEGNGSGDFANLLYSDAFMELPAELTNFKKGEAYRIWPFKQIIS